MNWVDSMTGLAWGTPPFWMKMQADSTADFALVRALGETCNGQNGHSSLLRGPVWDMGGGSGVGSGAGVHHKLTGSSRNSLQVLWRCDD
jgi:hypothetical protein